MSTGIFSIGVSGLSAAQLGLLTTEHNVVNANTPGYTRQTTVQASNVAINTGAGAIGQGVHVQTIKRLYDQYLTSQVNSAQTQVSELDAFYSQITQVTTMLADPNAGLSPALQDFFAGVQDVASNPSLLPSRQSMISSAQTMAARFQNLDAALSEMADQVNGRISDAVSQINTYASQIADINQRIIVSEAGYGQPANDLQDQRDQLIAEVNKFIKVSTSTNSNGTFNVFIGNGQQLVVGTQVLSMTATASTSDPTKIVVGLKTAGGTQQLPESLITGGELGGLISFRNNTLGVAQNELGRVATSLALTFNAQHQLGQDLQGNILGDTNFIGDFFTIADPKLIANSKNAGSGSLSVAFAPISAPSAPDFSGNFYTNLGNSNYQVAFGAAGAYTITRLTDNAQIASGTGAGVVSFEGLNLTISAVGNAGDSFVIQPVVDAAKNIDVNARIAADPRLVAVAAPVSSAPAQTNMGSMVLSQGIVGQGYSAAGLPVSVTATATTLNGVPGAWTAVYSDGSSSTGPGNISLLNGAAKLSKISFSGMSFDITGTPAVGDSFSITRNTGGVQDSRNALLLAKLQTQNTVAGGTATFQSAYASIVADSGIQAREAKVRLSAQTSVLNQAVATRESLSGVNLDEEAANLMKYQQAYQAASKILQVGNTLFDTILALGR
ncbi:MAG: flagellar hook-associated protein FlgK [Propionivibrio sp.]|jgi:flagellar hook-associated protein 1 FlgK|nr:flagellar hook-associated protein FlgK [Propionivibrio sp.]